MSARIFSPSDVVTHASRARAARPARRARGRRRRGGCGLLPGEVDTAVLGPARLIGPLRVQRSTRQHRQLRSRRRPAGRGGRAPTARASRTAPGCTPACRAGRCGRSAGAGRLTFFRHSASRASTAVASVVSADSLKSKNTASSVHCVGGGAGAFSLLQNPLTQSSSCGQSLSVLQGFFAVAGPLHAVLAARALLVVRARLALVGDALLVRGAVGLAAAVAGDRLALARLAGLAGRAVVRVAALLALVGDAELLGVAVLVGLARRVVGRAAGRRTASDGERRTAQARACSLPRDRAACKLTGCLGIGDPLVGENRTFHASLSTRAPGEDRQFQCVPGQPSPLSM